jgi:hypothetical protein
VPPVVPLVPPRPPVPEVVPPGASRLPEPEAPFVPPVAPCDAPVVPLPDVVPPCPFAPPLAVLLLPPVVLIPGDPLRFKPGAREVPGVFGSCTFGLPGGEIEDPVPPGDEPELPGLVPDEFKLGAGRIALGELEADLPALLCASPPCAPPSPRPFAAPPALAPPPPFAPPPAPPAPPGAPPACAMLTEGTNTIAPAADNATESANDENHLLSFMILFPV